LSISSIRTSDRDARVVIGPALPRRASSGASGAIARRIASPSACQRMNSFAAGSSRCCAALSCDCVNWRTLSNW
jgi:hypothetical protein